jgi:putative transposase
MPPQQQPDRALWRARCIERCTPGSGSGPGKRNNPTVVTASRADFHRPARETVIGFIAEHKDHQVAGPDGGAGLRWGVEPMCAVLSEHGVPISPSTYYEWIAKTPTRRQMRDAELVEIITAAREDKKKGKFVQTLGSRKLWIWLRSQGHDVARCTVERIMRENGWEGARYGSKHTTTIADDTHRRYPDLVDRRFYAAAPNRLWVADFTYVSTWMGFVYVAFVIDAYSRRILGWRAARSMTTDLVLDAIEHAFFTRAQHGTTSLHGLIAHSDAGAQGGFQRSSQHLDDGGVWWRQDRVVRLRTSRVFGDGSGARIGRCAHRCGHRGVLSPRVRFSVRSGG